MNRLLWKLGPFKWTIHNLVAHPLMEIIYLFGLGTGAAERLSIWIHDITIPEPPCKKA